MPSPAAPSVLTAIQPVVRTCLRWPVWAERIQEHGLTIDRPRHTPHPDAPSIIYPLDYGYINDTVGTDGEPVDVFVGTGSTGLVGALLTADYRRRDRELTFLWRCTPTEVYTAHGFVNYDRSLMEGVLVLRRPMAALWAEIGRGPDA
jgi:inorganic pyrophosphatase